MIKRRWLFGMFGGAVAVLPAVALARGVSDKPAIIEPTDLPGLRSWLVAEPKQYSVMPGSQTYVSKSHSLEEWHALWRRGERIGGTA